MKSPSESANCQSFHQSNQSLANKNDLEIPFLPHLYLEPSQSVPLLFATCHHPDKWKHLSKSSHNIQSRAIPIIPLETKPPNIYHLKISFAETRDSLQNLGTPNLPNTRNFTFLAFGRYGNTMRFQRRFILVPAKEMRYVALTQLDNQNKNANRFHANHCRFIAECSFINDSAMGKGCEMEKWTSWLDTAITVGVAD